MKEDVIWMSHEELPKDAIEEFECGKEMEEKGRLVEFVELPTMSGRLNSSKDIIYQCPSCKNIEIV